MRQRNRTVVQEVIKSCLPFTSIGTPTFFLYQSIHHLEESTFLATSSPRFGTTYQFFFLFVHITIGDYDLGILITRIRNYLPFFFLLFHQNIYIKSITAGKLDSILIESEYIIVSLVSCVSLRSSILFGPLKVPCT